MKPTIAQHWLLVLLLSLMLAACGGGKSNDQNAGGGIGGTGGTASGTITGFGSVIVNGIEFNTGSTAVTIDDDNATDTDLRIGQVVEVQFTNLRNGSATAAAIKYRKSVEGPVETVDLTRGLIEVLGQTVKYDDTSVFSGFTKASDLQSNNADIIVEVSGFDDPAYPAIRATRIAKKGQFQNGVTDIRVRGPISSLDPGGAKTFKIRGQTIDYSTAILPTTPLVTGLTVEVRGNTRNGAILVATSVKTQDAISVKEGDDMEVEGLITAFSSQSSFTVAGVTVDASTATLENGKAADLAAGVKVEVEGKVETVNTDKVLVATKVSFHPEGKSGSGNVGGTVNIRLEGPVQDRNSKDKTLKLFGKVITLNDQTQFEDERSNERPFNLTNFATVLKSNDHIAVRAYKTNAGIIATRVERNNDTELVVQGPVDEANQATKRIKILGITVQTGAGTQFEGIDERPLPEANFYSQVSAGGATVKAKGVSGGLLNSIDASQGEVQIRN